MDQPFETYRDLRIRPAEAADAPAIVALVHGVLREYGLSPDPEGVDADLPRAPEAYAEGEFVVVLLGDELVGTAGLMPVADDTLDLRKMYLKPAVRGQGLGRYLLERAIRIARQRGYRRLSLETHSNLKEAVALYRAHGFKPLCGGVHTCRCDLAFVLELQ
ncbi:MAG: GNAT family N-acetyltransferase [Gammaproteobacteria bacterium]|nr:GNAT family N-acetyltransferase [Gammaproteobacteria bacterium]